MPIQPLHLLRRLRDLVPAPAYRAVPERMDQPEESLGEIRRTLLTMRLVNWLGGSAVVLHHLDELLRGWPSERTCQVLDLGTGAADIPLAILRWARRRGLSVEILATDVSPRILELARERVGHEPAIRLQVEDARHLSFADGSFDIVTSSLTLHHVESHEAAGVLREMARVARVGIVVNDLERCFGAYAAVWLSSLAPGVAAMARHDGLASVVRAFTAGELSDLARQAGVERAEVQRHRLWRQALVGRKAESFEEQQVAYNTSPGREVRDAHR